MEIVFNEHNAYKLLKEISFPRLGGSPEEKRAAGILQKYLKSLSLKPREEAFQMQAYQDIHASLEVLSPYRKRYNVSVMGNSGSTPDKGVRSEVVYLNSFSPEHINTVRNKIALVYQGNINKTMFLRLKQNNVRALIRIYEATPQLPQLKQGDLFLKAYGKIPSVFISYEDGLEMIHKDAKIVNVISKQKEFKATSRNVVAEIKGTDLPNEKIYIVGHYDSVNKVAGCVDNAGGSVTIADFARHFAQHPPKRTVVFIWFGSEEMGLKGSWAYTEKHKKELAKPKPPIKLNTPQVKLLINVDVAGTVMGNNGSVICGSEQMATFVDSFAKEKGIPFQTAHSAYSSDNIPFNEKGIPSIALHRYSGNYGHTPLDNMRLISPSGLKILGQFGLELANRIANAVDIPFDLSIPDADKKATYAYVERANPFYKKP